MENEIYDIREPEAFRCETFSGFKKTEVRSELIQSLLQGRVENACYWIAELVCCGSYVEIWDILFGFVGKYVSIHRPLILPYLEKRFNLFKRTCHEMASLDSLLELRNNATIRGLFAEIVSVFCLVEKRASIEEIRIDNVGNLVNRLKADRPDYIMELGILKPEDPKELVIGLNELAYHLMVSRSAGSCFFWIEWIIEFIDICRKRGEPLFCYPRIEITDKKWMKDPNLLVLEVLQEVAKQNGKAVGSLEAGKAVGSLEAGKAVGSLATLFRSRYQGPATLKKRKMLLYYAVLLITEPGISWKHEILDEKGKTICQVATESVDRIYGTMVEACVKKGMTTMSFRKEEKKKNLQDSLRKMSRIAELDVVFNGSGGI
jgi:hypothetical protein